MVAWSFLIGCIRARLCDDPHLLIRRDVVLRSSSKELVLNDDGALQLQGRNCLPGVDGLRESISKETHSRQYFIHSSGMVMYHGFVQYYKLLR